MNGLATLFLVAATYGLLALPRRVAPLPLLAGACYMTLGQEIQLGPFNFTFLRLLILAGVIRILARGERPAGGITGLDATIIAWAAWAILCSVFHVGPAETLVNHLGLVFETLGVFFLLRCFCCSSEDVIGIIILVAILLVPVSLEMLNEQLTGRNWFAFLGGVEEVVTVRGERLRAQGPFAHPILAGTVGAGCFPLMIGIWRPNPRVAGLGLAACFLIVLCSASSGPIMTVAAAAFALCLWRWRHFTGRLLVGAVVCYILLDVLMKAPAYYLISRIDLTGSSTGWHRAALIEASINHLDEWWFAGTDRTVHWMPTGVQWSQNHTDITNHYLKMGVRGGLPLMFLFMGSLALGFRYVGRCLRPPSAYELPEQFLIWAVGAALFSHAVTFVSVSYFDQSAIFIYLCLAMIAGLLSECRTGTPPSGGQILDITPNTVFAGQSAQESVLIN